MNSVNITDHTENFVGITHHYLLISFYMQKIYYNSDIKSKKLGFGRILKIIYSIVFGWMEEGEENISDDGRISHDEHEALAMKQFTRTIGISPDPATQLVMDRTATRKRFFGGEL